MSELLSAFNFEIILAPPQDGSADLWRAASFSEISGLEISVEVETLWEGGYNHGSRQLVKKASPGTLVLKRGVTLDGAFWAWAQRCAWGPYPLPYLHGEIRQLAPGGQGRPYARWTFVNGIATRVSGAALSALSANVPIEELHIAHEGLSREPT